MKIKKVHSLKGEVTIPGDKSVSHRGIMLGSIAKGITEVHNFLQGADCLSTISCFQKMGVLIEHKSDSIIVHGNGLHGLKAPKETLDCGNSGTTTRLISGILAAQDFEVILTGDESIQKRPMKRIMDPLNQMGGSITSLLHNNCAPLTIKGKPLHGIHFSSKVASAQIKSAILLAGLYADSKTSVTEPYLSRNHTEQMLTYFGAKIQSVNCTATIEPANELYGNQIMVPGDISSAAYFMAAGLIIPNSELLIKNVGINPTRSGIIEVCRRMGADLTLYNIDHKKAEPTADILVKTSLLKAVVIEGAIIPTLIDELPIIAVLACFSEGQTVIKDASELKVKESNRIEIMVKNLSAMGADITETEDGMIINGQAPLKGTSIHCEFDHRIAMSFAIAALASEGETQLLGEECVNISYPEFFTDIHKLIQ